MLRYAFLVAAGLQLSAATAAQADIAIQMLKPIVEAKVDLVAQRMHVLVNGNQIHTWKISSGRRGYSTPQGTFSPYRSHKMWRSRKYNNAPMPFAVFYDGGYAVHGTSAVRRLGRPASHGCVRLRTGNAKKFYELVRRYGKNRTRIRLTGTWAGHAKTANKSAKHKTRSASKRSRTVRARRNFGRMQN